MTTSQRFIADRVGLSKSGLLKGFTLIEVVVSSSIFIMLSVVLVALMGYNQSASEKVTASVDAETKVLILFEKMRLELKSARVIDCTDGELSYWVVLKKQGSTVFDSSSHRLAYLPASGAVPDVATLALTGSDKQLVRTFQGGKQLFVSLDKDGEIHFVWEPSIQQLKIQGRIGSVDRKKTSLEAIKPFSFTFSLNNVE